ncbi:MAG: aldehyde dehydrogenase family protein [Bacteriovoracales bacterium]|nr:aldehyde dehydrogenase family protein [Bacteriovoracales bacterium]
MEYQLAGDYFDGCYHKKTKTATFKDHESFDKFSPANTNHKLWELDIEFDHIDAVVQSAEKGFKAWKTLSFEERSQYLNRYKEIVLSKKEEIARAISLEVGKPYWESLTEAQALASKVDVTLGDSLRRIAKQSLPDILPKTRGEIYYRPIGPTLILGPFNFPCHLANGQILSSLLAGNSIIFKPSEKTPYSAQLLFDCFVKSEFPPGTINLIQGGGETATRLIQEKAIKGIFFTGSKDVGQKILQQTHHDLSKLVALELGGKNTTIVHRDANTPFALSELLKSCFLTSGQRCTSTSLVAIHRSLLDQFIDSFHRLTKKIIIDHPIEFEKSPFMGPLIDKKSMENYLTFMGTAKREKAQEIMRGKAIEKKYPGYYITPSIHYMENPDKSSHFIKSEIFGPNVTFIPYEEIEDAIALANAPDYGLAASVFTSNDTIFSLCASNIEVGILNHNRSTVGASSRFPFGGVGDSGNYRPAGVSMVDSCVYPQSCLRISPPDHVDFSNIEGIDQS